MTLDEAKHTIQLHAGFVLDEEKLGLIGRLRPYQGLDESDFAEIAEAIIEVYRGTKETQTIERSVVGALWEICSRSRILALNPNSGIRSNNLAGMEDIELLSIWICIIENMSIRFLMNIDLPICIGMLLEYISSKHCVNILNFRRFFEEIKESISYDDQDVSDYAEKAFELIMAI